MESALGVPVCIDEQPVGALIIGWRRPRAVSGEEQRLVLALADQVAGAVVQTQLYDETYRQRTFPQNLINHTPAGIVAFTCPSFACARPAASICNSSTSLSQRHRPLIGRRLNEFLPQAAESGIQAIFEQVPGGPAVYHQRV